MGRQNKKLINNLEKYEEKKAKQQKSKIHGQSLLNKQVEKKRVHACTTHNGVKVYAVWYK